MNNNIAKPSLFRIIWSDYIALVAGTFPLIVLGMYIAISYFGILPGFRGHDPINKSEGAPIFLYMTIVAALIGFPIVAWRVRSFQTIFTRGTEVQGHITNIYFHRDRGRVEYTYDYSGQTHNGWNALHKTARAKTLQSGDEVVLIVDRDNPKRALIRDLYV